MGYIKLKWENIMSNATRQETAVRELIDNWAQAARNSDLEAVMALYSPDVRAFDALGALQFKGAETYRKHWETCMSYIPPGGEMILEVHDLEVSLGGDIAFAHYVSRCGCVDDKGQEMIGWMRATVCCRNTPDGWRIAHEHYSMPFDPETMKVPDNLEP